METLPHELFSGCEDGNQRAARMGRYLVLQEMGFFGEKTNVELARGAENGTFIASVCKRFSGTYGDVRGCEPADIEVAAEYLGVFDEIFDVEASQTSKHIQDR